MEKYKTTAIILAAGQGKRMKSKIAKQYLILQGHPILYYTIKAFENHESIDEIILVVGQDDLEYCKSEIIDLYNFKKVSKIVVGGSERYESVYEGLKVMNDSHYVLIHDGARPFVNSKVLYDIINSVQLYKACIVGVPVKDTIKSVSLDGVVNSTPDRNTLWSVQTPQAFEYSLIKKAYDEVIKYPECSVTDDAMVVELMTNHKVKVVEGDYNNIKITTPEDLIVANQILTSIKTENSDIV